MLLLFFYLFNTVYFERDGGKVAARELDSDPRRAVTAMLRSTQPEEHIGTWDVLRVLAAIGKPG